MAQASALVRRLELKLRLPDAIHLAFAGLGRHTLVTNDRQLYDAAAATGIAVIATNLP